MRFFGSELLFVYGENDPWGSERFAPSRRTRDTEVYEVAGGTHSANITQLAAEERAEATATVLRWAGQPPAPPAVQREAAPEPEPEEAITGVRP